MSAETERQNQLLDRIHSIAEADEGAREQLFTMAYEDMREMANRLMSRERPGHTLRPTALVHETYLWLIDHDRIRWESRAHIMAIAARAMRQILVDHARQRGADKRGGGLTRVTLEKHLGVKPDAEVEILDLDRILTRLSGFDERAARVVELRAFGGLTTKEVSHVLGVSSRTVDNDWRVARMWLNRELEGAA